MNIPYTETPSRAPSIAAIDFALTAQSIVAWAGEAGEERRLGWWRTDLISEFGGEDLFRRLLPATWAWATLEGAREAARRRDAELRRDDSAPDKVLSLFNLGFELDERLDERLASLKSSHRTPDEALPGLAFIRSDWRPDRFLAWLDGPADFTPTSIGRRLKGTPPTDLDPLIRKLLAALAPLSDAYPLPHYRRSP
jgi:hypothetical protein